MRLLRSRGYTHHHAAVHLDEATVAVVREAGIRGARGEPLYGLVIQAEIQNRIHHAGHRFACAGAHRQQQRVVAIAEAFTLLLLHFSDRRFDVGGQLCRVAALVVVEVAADVGADGESGRNRKTDRRHLGQICALAAEQIAHRAAAVGLPTERIDILRGLLRLRRHGIPGRVLRFLDWHAHSIFCCDDRDCGAHGWAVPMSRASPFLPAWGELYTSRSTTQKLDLIIAIPDGRAAQGRGDMDYQLSYVRVFVTDWPRAIRFYTETLEMTADADHGWMGAVRDRRGPARARARRSGRTGKRRVGRPLHGRFAHASPTSTPRIRTFSRRGVEFLGAPERQPWGGVLAHLRDPDGNVLTLLGR